MDLPAPRPPTAGGKKETRTPAGPPRRPSSSRPQVVGNAPEGYLAVGRIVGAHGIRGEVKVELWTDFPERFAPGLILALGPTPEKVVVVSARPHKSFVLLVLEGIRDRDAADALRGLWLSVPEGEAMELDDDTFWVHDLMGLQVESDDGRRLGTISEVLFTGANEVYVVRTPEGQEVLLPATDEVVLQIDLPTRRMTVHLLPGILDD